MARPWRIQYPGAIYHVISRGNNRQKVFLGDEDKRLFLDTLATAVSRFDLHLFAFCLMNNHYHLFLRTPGANLSQAMHWLNATYTIRFNRRRHRGGHLFQGRYKSVLVAEEAHWLHLSMYLHLNPVRAGMADNAVDYEWSSFRDYTRSRSRFGWLQPEEILSQYGSGAAQQRRNYRRECLRLAGKPTSFWEELRSAVVLGPAKVVEKLAKKYGPAGDLKEVPAFLEAKRPEVEFETELKRVAEVSGVKWEDLLRRHRNFVPRLLAYYHLVEQCGLRVSQVAPKMGVSRMAVSLGVRRMKERLAKDSALSKLVELLSLK
jgi:REP element-mobilizing transposase RayT